MKMFVKRFILLGILISSYTYSNSQSTNPLFSDDVWFFGTNETVEKTSPGIIFKDSIPYDASGISMVNSTGRSLSVGIPSCQGYVFYASYDTITSSGQVYNEKHKPMLGGKFNGARDMSDGMAAAYVGDNKFIFLAVTTTGDLNHYVIDMNKGEGLGEMALQSTISASISQGIELIPIPGTYTEYWLLYYTTDTKTLMISKITENSVTNVHALNNVLVSAGGGWLPGGPATGLTNIVTSLDFSRIAILGEVEDPMGWGSTPNIFVFDFNLTTGVVSGTKTTELSYPGMAPLVPSIAFSPNNDNVFIGMRNIIFQGLVAYNYTNNDFIVTTIGSPGNVGGGAPDAFTDGGGLKLGMDSTIYIKTEGYIYGMTAIYSNVWSIFPFIDVGFPVSSKGGGLFFSTGLTPPGIDPPGSVLTHIKPVANTDIVSTYDSLPVALKPFDNDTYDNVVTTGLVITSIKFTNVDDNTKGDIVFNSATEVVTFTQKNNHTFTKDSVINAFYTVKDKGSPIQYCDEAFIKILVRALPKVTLADSCTFVPKLSVDIQNPNIGFIWQEYDGTNWTDITSSEDKMFYTPDMGTITTEKIYRVRIYQKLDNTKSTYTKPQKLVVKEKSKLSAGTWYRVTITQ